MRACRLMSYPRFLTKPTRWGVRGFAALLVPAIALAVYAVVTFSRANFHVVIPGVAYRSAQMNAGELAGIVQRYGIRSVINLRGKDPAESWYRSEMETSARLKVVHYDRALSARNEMSMDQMDGLVDLLRKAPKPVLIHCRSGADRAGLASALYCVAIAGQQPVNADKQLTVWYGHFPVLRTIAMDHSFWRYVHKHAARPGLPGESARTSVIARTARPSNSKRGTRNVEP